MFTKNINRILVVWLFIILPLLAAFIFRKSFDLGLYGDDWQHLYILWRDFFVYKTKSFFDIRSYLNPYWPEYFYLGVIQYFWGYYPPAYFIVSFFCRVFANIALYFFSYQLTKSKLAAFLTTLIFLVSAAGLQTTDWVFNMNTYAGLGLLAIAATIYLKLKELRTFKSWYYPLFIISFTLALAVVPTRMHGAVPFIFLTELFITFIVERQRIKFDKYMLVRLGLAALIFVTLVYFKSFGEGSYANGRFSDSYKLIEQLVQNGYHSWWLYFVGILGHLFLPDNINLAALNSLFSTKTLSGALLIVTVLSTLFLSLSTSSVLKTKKKIYFLPVVIFNIFWFIFLMMMSKIDNRTSGDVYLSISLGGQLIFWAFWFYLIGRKNYPDISKALIVAIIWIISLTVVYWSFTPYFVIETTGRYMTMGAAGMAIFLGALSTLLFKAAITHTSKANIYSKLTGSLSLEIPLMILLLFLITNFSTGQNYLNILHQTRNKDLTERTWKKLLQDVPNLDPNAPSVFYFTTDNPLSLEGVLVFGFYMRAGLEWRIPIEHMTPLPSKDYAELLAYVKDGSPLQTVHGRKASPVPLSRIFAFDFRNGELINITDLVRQQLTKDSKTITLTQ